MTRRTLSRLLSVAASRLLRLPPIPPPRRPDGRPVTPVQRAAYVAMWEEHRLEVARWRLSLAGAVGLYVAALAFVLVFADAATLWLLALAMGVQP